MTKKIILLILFLITSIGFSQEIKSYTWEDKPVFKEIPEEYKNQPAVVLFDKRWIHTRVGYYAFASFVMNHTAIKINKAEEINKYNKIKAEDNGYIRELRDFHARIIKPNGEIKVLSQDKIVQAEVDKVKSIVFEGVEAGDILEYYFILKENPSAYGVEIFQKEIPVLYAEFCTTEDGVNFDIFSSKEFSKKEGKGKKVSIAENIPPFIEEKSAKTIKNLVKLIYMINVTGVDNFSWYVFFPQYYKKPTFKNFTKSQARDFIEKLNVKSGTTDEKVAQIDLYIKENFDFVWRGEKAKKIKNLNDGKLKLEANDIFDLYAFAFKELKIPYEIAVGMSRFKGEVDIFKFVVPLNHEFMYYIPETKKFVSPYEKYLSYGNPAYEIQGSTGVLYNPTKSFSSEEISFPIMPADYTVIETQNEITLSKDYSTATIEKIYSNTGYEGQLNRNIFKELKTEEAKETIEYIKERFFKGIDVKILEHSLKNEDFKNNYSNAPIIAKITSQTNESLTESAGNLLIVNLGKVIGKQQDLYQESERKYDVDLSYAKTYKHQITFNIPEGYEIESYKDLIFDKKMEGDKKQKCSFESKVRVEDNKLIINVTEVYENITYTLGMYQEYRKVINASSDFTKASLILKPKK
ncbi:DUF3857 domain-containing protein [Flavobacterium sp.]|uniref:DUF3857 domain-containing protein n=1 Tax=Flavobacterium sp. TaxID=239 RepID=UPI00260AFFB7|nr:DUF3857 domain-containing protein [Flavobacterium sp.]